MLKQLLPLLVVAGIFSFYGIAQIAKAYWQDSIRIAAEAYPQDIEDILTNITPHETPFMRTLTKENNVD